MDNQDQRRTHTPGHENHGVHVCHKCGWHFPNPHPSAKQRRAHKKICGTIEGYKTPHFNGSDDERASDDDHKTPQPGLVVSGSNNGNVNDGIGEKLDDVFSDAAADFPDGAQRLGVKDRLQDGLDSGTDVERVNTNEQKLSGPFEYNNFHAADVSPLVVESSNDSQIANPKILHGKNVEVGNIVGLQGQLSGSMVDPLTSSVANLRTEEFNIVHGDDFSGLSSVNKESNLKGKDEVKSERDMVEFVDSSDNILGETCEGVSKIAGSDAVSLDHEVGDGAITPKEKKEPEFFSLLPQDELAVELNSSIITSKAQVESAHAIHFTTSSEFVDSSDNILGETCEGVSKIAGSDAVSLDHEVGGGAITPKEKKGPEFFSLLPQDELAVELNSSIITSKAQVESAHAIHFTTSSDVKVLQEKEEDNANIDPLPIHDVSLNVTYPQSESLKHEEVVTKEDDFHFNTSQLSERSDVLSPDMHVMDSNMKTETEGMHAEDCTKVSPVKPTLETDQGSHEIGGSMKTEMNENHFSKEPGLDDVLSNSQPKGGLMVSANESRRVASFGFATSEATNIDNISHHVKNTNEISDLDVDGKEVGANVENDSDFILKDFQPSDFLLTEAKHSSETGKLEECEITDAQCKQIPTETDPSLPKSAKDVIDGSARKSNATECSNIDPVSDLNEDEINSNIKLYDEHNTSVTDSHEARDAVLLVKAAEDPASKHTTDSFINTEPSAQHDSVVEGDSGGEPDAEASGITVVLVQDQSSVNLVRLGSSGVVTSADLHEVQDEQLLVKAGKDLDSKHTSHSSIKTDEPAAQHGSAADDSSGGEPGRKVSGITAVPVQDQSGNNFVKQSSGIDASVDSGSRCDSLEVNWGSVSVLSMQSDVPAVTDAENLPSIEAGKSNLNIRQAAADRQQSGKSEVFELPSFTTLVESSNVVVSPKCASSSEVQNLQQANSNSQAGWFPTLNHVMNDSQGRKKNEEIIAKVTNWSTSKEHTPLKSLLGETTYSNKPNSPIMEENSVNQKGGKVPENNNGSGLTTVNSILGPESPATEVVKGEAANEWNSPARYPANIKREKRKLKSRPFWIQLVCCSAVDPQRR